MTLLQLFRTVTKDLERRKVTFAVAGGVAAGAYRSEIRATHDLDFIVATEPGQTQALEDILSSLHLNPGIVRQADLDGGPMFAIKKKNTPVMILVGRDPKDKTRVGVDFLLSSMPWVPEALVRAQHNQVNFGFGPVPCLTPEDLFLAKLAALQSKTHRLKDIDDIQNIFAARNDLDLAYLSAQMKKLGIFISPVIRKQIPAPIRKMARGRID